MYFKRTDTWTNKKPQFEEENNKILTWEYFWGFMQFKFFLYIHLCEFIYAHHSVHGDMLLCRLAYRSFFFLLFIYSWLLADYQYIH